MRQEPNPQIQDTIQEIKKDQIMRFINTGANSYKQLGFTILSLLNTSQTHLFSLENTDHNKQEKQKLQVDIYNLLQIAKNLIPHTEFEFLDKIMENEK